MAVCRQAKMSLAMGLIVLVWSALCIHSVDAAVVASPPPQVERKGRGKEGQRRGTTGFSSSATTKQVRSHHHLRTSTRENMMESLIEERNITQEESVSSGLPAPQRFLQTSSLPPIPLEGDPACRCLPPEGFGSSLGEEGVEFVGSGTDLGEYGVQCHYHDLDSSVCQVEDAPNWCFYAWCWVDPDECSLLNIHSKWFPESARYYSYAACRYPDVFFSDFTNLRGQTLRIGLNSNSGGWQGSYYTPKGDNSSITNLDDWTGPSVSLIRNAAAEGDVSLSVIVPPPMLVERASEFFDSQSSFDVCVYAAALGYVDICVAQYTVTEARAAVTEWFVLNTQDLYLIGKVQKELPFGSLERFANEVNTIFLPFEKSTWMFIVFFVIPILSVMLLIHEHGQAGSRFEKIERIIRYEDDEPPEQQQRFVPFYEHLVKSIYIGFLAVLQMGYSTTIITPGGKLHLIGVSFFILTLLAVYTANLAAILTRKGVKISVLNLEDALKRRFKLCAERKNMQIVTKLQQFDDSFFIVDPPELGGDGLPGFNCPACDGRQRVFDFIDSDKADEPDNTLYCHAAIAPIEDLEVLHTRSQQCDKRAVGEAVGSAESGMPVFAGKSSEIIPLLINLKNSGVYERQLIDWKPRPMCDDVQLVTGGETASLSIEQLSGIWLVSFLFALMGLVASYTIPLIINRQRTSFQRVNGYDQSGHKINLLEREDDWIYQQGHREDRKGRKILDKPLVKRRFENGFFFQKEGSELSVTTRDKKKRRVSGNAGSNQLDVSKGSKSSKWAPSSFYNKNAPVFDPTHSDRVITIPANRSDWGDHSGISDVTTNLFDGSFRSTRKPSLGDSRSSIERSCSIERNNGASDNHLQQKHQLDPPESPFTDEPQEATGFLGSPWSSDPQSTTTTTTSSSSSSPGKKKHKKKRKKTHTGHATDQDSSNHHHHHHHYSTIPTIPEQYIEESSELAATATT